MADDERFDKWEAMDGLSPVMLLHAKHHDREGFRLILKSGAQELKSLRILFDGPLCYRGTQEELLLRRLYERDPIYPWPLFIVRNSRYARWFYAQATEAVDKDGYHYHIAAQNEVVDVLSVRPPILTWLDDF